SPIGIETPRHDVPPRVEAFVAPLAYDSGRGTVNDRRSVSTAMKHSAQLRAVQKRGELRDRRLEHAMRPHHTILDDGRIDRTRRLRLLCERLAPLRLRLFRR